MKSILRLLEVWLGLENKKATGKQDTALHGEEASFSRGPIGTLPDLGYLRARQLLGSPILLMPPGCPKAPAGPYLQLIPQSPMPSRWLPGRPALSLDLYPGLVLSGLGLSPSICLLSSEWCKVN